MCLDDDLINRKKEGGNTMYLLKISVASFLMFFLCFAPSGCSKKEPPKIRITGSTTILPFLIRVSDLYSEKEDVEIRVSSGGSMKGIAALIAGKCDIAMCSSPIPAKMLAHARSKDIQIKGFSVAHDMIVPIVHPSNPINNLSLEQLDKIFSGNIKSWAAFGGQPALIDVVIRTASSGTGEVWKQIVLQSDKLKKDSTVQNSNSGVLAFVAEHPDAIGYISFAILNHEVKPLSVDGVAPTVENAKQGTYPIFRQLYLYVDEKNLSYDMKSFIVFILSSKGQHIIKEMGFIPKEPLI